ncbi:hypothetical protein FVE85_7225 [Porphyridium purpureum]|uniref:Methyltransferase domain-containing protein n=1 Tax=Porphyridium purpureum TaxID=35688 RepID=A0A5J4Z946_PORPP|nr:hypothetical protein FVE85_7225 [Porphyridium purpureum]|eukprot:POR1416..scf295_1
MTGKKKKKQTHLTAGSHIGAGVDVGHCSGVRDRYAACGSATEYYEKYGAQYQNPHEAQVLALLRANETRVDYSRTLDFCAGSGEVTLALQRNARGGRFEDRKVLACDPFTADAFALRTGTPLDWEFSFEDVARGALDEVVAPHQRFSACVCSFALHLAPEALLWPVCHALLRVSARLVIITPHKRPVLELVDPEKIELEFADETPTERGKMVRLKCYKLRSIDTTINN